ncbi:MAG: hypothetical protein HOB14_16240 [Gammaproteobacteria bacterium]|jgi:hypothetical protein|nr:hypothetical protein [Gammaproteobacteria bacterium]MBT3723217.1 hypothetical protein [Gammaproteobacteria bacterium]MBT4076672.1 hypothetical protein [Gammaproteobacteria bacterium]MBT4195778.1 hypothetical protein [Gammaproteobacteria bacterium]MBT4450151.1 hypothetical protein [Gammaproteobacteria bacterium]
MSLVSEVIQTTIIRILKPLTKVLLRNGIAYAQFADIARKVYVDTGFEEARRQGQKQTVSNVSILTGINRKEVKRLKESLLINTDNSLRKFNRIVRVIAGWQHDEEFLDSDHEPRDLLLEGKKGSFGSLVKRYSGDMPVVAMLNALIDSGNIKVIDNGNIQLINLNYLPTSDSDKKLNILGIDTAELIQTIDHNINVKQPEDAWFQRKASNTQVKIDALPKIKQRINKKAQQLLEDIDAAFSENESDNEHDSCPVSIGIYFTQKKANSEEE